MNIIKGFWGFIGGCSGAVVKGFSDASGITAAAQRINEHVQNVQNSTNRTINLGEQAVANGTALGNRTITHLTGSALIITNWAAALGTRGMRQIEMWSKKMSKESIGLSWDMSILQRFG